MKTIIALLLLTTTAFAQGKYPEPVERPSDEVIRRALLGAYVLNGHSMKGGLQTFDMTIERNPLDVDGVTPNRARKGDRK
jgi:hypothetical protein